MPRVVIKKMDYKISDLSMWIIKKMKEQKVSQQELGDMFKISQSAISGRIRKAQFDYKELILVFNKLGATDDEILRYMKL